MTGPTRIRAVMRKEFRHLLRDPRALGIVLVLPIVELLLFAYAISFDVRHVSAIAIDYDKTPASRAYLDAYTASSLFTVIGEAPNPDAVDEAFRRGEASAAIVVPAGFEKMIASDARPQVAIWLNGAQANTARIAKAYATALNEGQSRAVTIEWAQRQGASASGALEPRLRTWYNPDRVSSVYLVPGVIVVIIMIVAVQQTAVSLVRERDQHTQEQLMLSPLTNTELMVGKLLPWTLLAFLDIVVIVALSVWLFGVPLTGSVAALGVGFVLFTFSALGIGLMVSAVAPSLDTANVLALLLAFLPAFMLSGFAFPLDAIPAVLQWLSYAFPARYMLTLSRDVFLKGAGFEVVWGELAALAAYAVAALVISTLLYRRTLRR